MPLTTSEILKNRCFSCGYTIGNLIRIGKKGNRYAVKCGECDIYQYSLEAVEGGVR